MGGFLIAPPSPPSAAFLTEPGLTVMKNIVIWSCGALKNKKEETQYA